jgi:protein-tyrosine phosphatase
VYRKHGDRLALCSRILLAPVILGHFGSLLYYSRRSDPWNEILPGLWMGRRLSDAQARQAMDLGVTAVLDLTSEFSEAPSFRAARYLNVPILDLTAPTSAEFAEAVSFIKCEMERGTVYVHCKVGYSRSAAIIGGYLLEKGDCGDARDAVDLLRGKRPGLVVRDEVVSFLQTCTTRD